jgi:meso-butanediol dehydrogenase/(S,S)-butanediol dehydrogenase/diacetyl reductase
MAAADSLSGKVALITGAARAGGIGAEVALRLAQEGCHVVLTDIARQADGLGSASELSTRVAEIERQGGSASQQVCDVTSEESVAAACTSTVESCGRLDILINNAGIGFLMSPLVDVDIDDWDKVLDVNLRGAFLATKHAARHMIGQGSGGRIINIASQAAKSGFPHAAAYVSSKHGMVGLTRVAALELGAHGITVNAVCPNHITTGLGDWQNKYFSALFGQTEEEYLAAMRGRIPLGRTGRTSDIANMCAFLCSDAADYVTGEAINVSGGEEMH